MRPSLTQNAKNWFQVDHARLIDVFARSSEYSANATRSTATVSWSMAPATRWQVWRGPGSRRGGGRPAPGRP